MKPSRFSDALIARVEAAMTACGEPPRIIAARLPGTPITTVRHAIADLVMRRRAVYDGEIGRRLYRRISDAERAA